ncbi:MAG: translesion DNA synthesis-associated protein ImuA [Pelomonas sp.]|nr:translesion DNA synthesis-associated protein ImuA [Roseateles sp.]
MPPVSLGLDAVSPLSSLPSPLQNAVVDVHEPLPPQVEAALWRGHQLGSQASEIMSTGFDTLDAVLPGGGWPCGSLTEILVPQFSVVELRLLLPLVGALTTGARAVALVGPPMDPHVPGLRHDGINERHLIWSDVDTPKDRLWATEQLVRSRKCGAVVAWLPHVRAESVRRLQVLASQCAGPVILCRPDSAARDASAAPLRLLARYETDWQISVDVLKRKGAPVEEQLHLVSFPGGVTKIMTPRLRHYSRLRPRQSHVVVVSTPAAAVHERSEAPETSEP